MKNTIVLDETFIIKVDGSQWTLYKDEETDVINPKTGKNKHVKDQWYFPSLKLTLKRYADESLKKSPDISSLMQRINELEEKIDAICQKKN